MDEGTGIFCDLCPKEFGTGDSLKFIQFDHVIKTYHKSCYNEVLKSLERMRGEASHNK